MDQQPPFSLSKRRRASHFSIDDKERILNIFKVCSEQNPKNNKTENVAFTAKAVGISVASVHNVLREYKNGHTLHPPKAYYRKRTIVDNINDETKSKLRRLVHSFFERNEPPTLNKILAAVHEDEEMLHFKRSTLRVLLKEIGFKLATNESLAIPSNSQLVSASANIMTSPKKQIILKSSSESPLISGYHLAKRLKLKDVSSPSRNESSSVSTVVSWTASEAEDEIRRLAVSKQISSQSEIIGDIFIENQNKQMEVDDESSTSANIQNTRQIIGMRLNKTPKTSAERGQEFRARKRLHKEQQQKPDLIDEALTEENQCADLSKIKISDKRTSAERTRRWREKKRGVSGLLKKQRKTAAERMREYRERKKEKRNINIESCTSKACRSPDLRFHNFPRPGTLISWTNKFGVVEKVDKRSLWIELLKMARDPSDHMKICSLHFRKEDYILPQISAKKRWLKSTANPSLNLPTVVRDKRASRYASYAKKKMRSEKKIYH